MPLHEVGYRPWNEDKSPTWNRWWIIAQTGVRLAFRSTWLSRSLILSWVPAVVVGVFFFLYEQSLVYPELRTFFQSLVLSVQANSELALQVVTDPEGARHDVWATLILWFFRYPQAVMMLVIVAMVAPRLISADLRNRGYLLYFSRPVSIWGYVWGKALVVWVFLSLITTFPVLLLYIVGLCLSPDSSAFFATWDLPIRALAASLVLMIPVSSLALACSAMTGETRYGVFAWFAFWIVGWVSYTLMRVAELSKIPRPRRRFRGPRRNDEGLSEEEVMEALQFSDWELFSPFHVLGRVQQYVFGIFPEDQSVVPYVIVLVSVTAICLWFVRRQLLVRLRG